MALGTLTFGSTCDVKTSHRILDEAVDSGINAIDTAETYPLTNRHDLAGRSEAVIGDWLKNQRRETIVIASKVAGPNTSWIQPPVRAGQTALDRVNITKAIEGSLRRLQTDYLDLYQVHWPDELIRFEEFLDPLSDLVREGKIRTLGLCNCSAWAAMKSLAISHDAGLKRIDALQLGFNFADRSVEHEIGRICIRENLALMAHSPLAGGFLTNKYLAGFPPDARYTIQMHWSEQAKQASMTLINPQNLELVESLQEIAKELNLSMAAFALAWTLRPKFITSTIVGARTTAQLTDSLKGVNVRLNHNVLDRVDRILDEFKGAASIKKLPREKRWFCD